MVPFDQNKLGEDPIKKPSEKPRDATKKASPSHLHQEYKILPRERTLHDDNQAVLGRVPPSGSPWEETPRQLPQAPRTKKRPLG